MADIPSDKQLSELLGGGESESKPGLDIGYYLHLLLRYPEPISQLASVQIHILRW